jgi:hypothetical protein
MVEKILKKECGSLSETLHFTAFLYQVSSAGAHATLQNYFFQRPCFKDVARDRDALTHRTVWVKTHLE